MTLRADDWNDYGFITMFAVTLWLSGNRRVELENVKILDLRRSEPGRVELPLEFERLPEWFCSLGQAPSYYEALGALESGLADEYLAAMRDVAASGANLDEARKHAAFEQSLVRFGSAEQALRVGVNLFTRATPPTIDGAFTFVYAPRINESPETFTFNTPRELPSRINAIVGYNGVGKTRLLANLAMVFGADSAEVQDDHFAENYGALHGESSPVSSVVAISYSAFDLFEIPGSLEPDSARDAVAAEHLAANAAAERKRAAAGETSARNYTYCGLRQISKAGRLSPRLKSIETLEREFRSARRLATGKLRARDLATIFRPVLAEPSFGMAGVVDPLTLEDDSWDDLFSQLSTGHKIVLNILMQLGARLERNSLVLLDEPEMHLHPSMIAALIASLNVALEIFASHAVIATHSPVVVQEVPARNVKVLRRRGRHSRFDPPTVETFGETISILTSEIFDLADTTSGYQNILAKLAVELGPERVFEMFDGRMSMQARLVVESERRAHDAED